MNGTHADRRRAGRAPIPGPSWHAIGTGDFNGDGFSDILWQNDERPGLDLGNERDQPDRRRQSSGQPQSRVELACGQWLEEQIRGEVRLSDRRAFALTAGAGAS